MIRLSRLADYGVVLAGFMAGSPARFHNAFDLAEATQLPAPTVSKILAALGRGGVLVSHRGAKGGYRLAKPPAEISVADIVSALDGPISLTLCAERSGSNCDVESICPNRRGWRKINAGIRKALEDVSLAEMAGPPMFEALEPIQPAPVAEAAG